MQAQASGWARSCAGEPGLTASHRKPYKRTEVMEIYLPARLAWMLGAGKLPYGLTTPTHFFRSALRDGE